MFARCLIDSPLYRHFDYAIPPELDASVKPGARVEVPFGKRHVMALVVACIAQTDVAAARIKSIVRVLDAEPLVAPSLLQLAQNVVHYYHQPPGELINLLFPKLLRDPKPNLADTPIGWRSTPDAHVDLAQLGRQRTARLLMEAFQAHPDGLDEAALRALHPQWKRALETLTQLGWVHALHAPPIDPMLTSRVALNDAQAHVVAEVLAAGQHFAPFLLDGVTGSGKTEVYLALAAEQIKAGRQVLILTPEIGLAPQLLDRAHRRLGTAVATLHSGLADGERLRAWNRARLGQAPLVIGTRSATFTPLPNLGLIIVDEEHDTSYKQQEGLRFSARDMAVLRAQQHNIPIILGSATPSLESLHNVARGRYRPIKLDARANRAQTPRVDVLDIRRQRLREGLSPRLIETIQQTLAAQEQVLLFLNRRGFAPALICHDCGWVCPCPHCDAKLTVHRQTHRLTCHHCGHQQRLFDLCPQCLNGDLRPVGLGTERIETALQEQLPDARILRVDRDTMRRKHALADALHQAKQGAFDILIGTQMLAKGHDLPALTLVGIVDGDQGLYSLDFRATERFAQLIVQVAGRAGRAERPGRVIIQTRTPEHALLQRLLHGGYTAFAEDALQERAQAQWPPFCHLALLCAEGRQREQVFGFLNEAAAQLEAAHGLEVLGPVAAPMERRDNLHRAHLLLRAPHRAHLQRGLDHWLPTLESLPQKGLRWFIDVDPIDLV